jgi:hypothetical protein
MEAQGDNQNAEETFTRPPSIEDLVAVCNLLNAEEARYAVIGGMAVNHYGLVRATQDIDLLVDDSADNMERVIAALSRLPDGAARELLPGEIRQYSVIRVNDEITIDLLGKASDVTFNDAESSIECDETLGTAIPFAGIEILIRTKDTYREIDRSDRAFLQELL